MSRWVTSRCLWSCTTLRIAGMAQNLFKRCLALALGVTFAGSTALAIPYASGVKRTGDTVTFILNQNAISVEVLRDGGNAVYPGTEAGLHSFSMAGFTKYEIRVTGNEAPGWSRALCALSDVTGLDVPRGSGDRRGGACVADAGEPDPRNRKRQECGDPHQPRSDAVVLSRR